MSTLITSHEAALQLAKQLIAVAKIEEKTFHFTPEDDLPPDFPPELREKLESGEPLTAIMFGLKLPIQPLEDILTHWGMADHLNCVRAMFDNVVEDISQGGDGVFILADQLWCHKEVDMVPSQNDQAIH